LSKFCFTTNELLELFSRTFQISLNLKKYEILLFNKRLDSMTKLDFTQLDNYQRFKIQLNNNSTRKLFDSYGALMINDGDEIVRPIYL